jgi:thiamine-phosphate pyrophosphorylase
MKQRLAEALRCIALTPGASDVTRAVDDATVALAAGATAIWLHERELDVALARTLAAELRARCSRSKTFLIVSAPRGGDALEFALGCKADAIHLGYGDPSPYAVRAIAPRGLAIGFSAHDPLDRDAIAAADYVTLSPFAPTPKVHPRPPLGVARFARLRATIDRPVVALGGISEHNVRAAIEAGAAGVAVRRAASALGRIVALLGSR